MSGYANDLIAQYDVLDPDTLLLEKPFTLQSLLTKVQQALHTPSQSKAAGKQVISSAGVALSLEQKRDGRKTAPLSFHTGLPAAGCERSSVYSGCTTTNAVLPPRFTSSTSGCLPASVTSRL